MSAKKKATPSKAKTAPAPKPGTTITRAFKGETLKLRVVADGFKLGRTTYKSLTAAARAVTGYASVNGRSFWLGKHRAKGGDA